MYIKNDFNEEDRSKEYKSSTKEYIEKNGNWEIEVNNIPSTRVNLNEVSLDNKTNPKLHLINEKPTKPTAVPAPVLSIQKPIKPTAYVQSIDYEEENKTPGPLNKISTLSQSDKELSNKKYVYSYGIKNIELSNSNYEDSGIFVSKPMKLKGNIVELSIESNEEHPLFNSIGGKATERMTSIEYYISYKSNPNQNDWHPILPEKEKKVLSERLFFVNTTAQLRFYADLNKYKETKVYKNGILMKESEWCLIDKGLSLQLLVKRDLTAIYTIDYLPSKELQDPWNLKVSSRDAVVKTKIDLFKSGTNHNKAVKLSNYPYVDYEYINKNEDYDPNLNPYKPFNVYLQDGKIAIEDGKTISNVFPFSLENKVNPFTKNVTNYKGKTKEALKKYTLDKENKYLGFEYRQEKDSVIFSETFNKADIMTNELESHGNATIAVEYQYLETDFRIKIIIRKNIGNTSIMSPRINDYKIKFKVMK